MTLKEAAEKYMTITEGDTWTEQGNFYSDYQIEEAFLAGAAFERERILGMLRNWSFRDSPTCRAWADGIKAQLKQEDEG